MTNFATSLSIGAAKPTKGTKRTAKSLALMSAAIFFTGATAALAQDAAPAPAPMATPAMAGPISANPHPYSVDLGGFLGTNYIGGALTGMAYGQTSPTRGLPGDVPSYMDLTNAQITLQKTDGWLQYYVQAGNYSFPTLGSPYLKSSLATPVTFGVVPEAYLKLQGDGDFSAFSIEGGKLPTLTGNEYNFTFENMNIERGVLWNIEPAISRGVQVNYSEGPLSLALSWNDGYYSKVLNTLSGMASYVFSPSDTVVLSGSGDVASARTPSLASGDIFDLIWTHTMGDLIISPYIQYSTTPAVIGLGRYEQQWGAALLTSYAFDDNFKLAGRFEYETSTGGTIPAGSLTLAPNVIGFGAGSNVTTFTLTPTYQYGVWFVRADVSYVGLGSSLPGARFGKSFNNKDQERVMLETGVVF